MLLTRKDLSRLYSIVWCTIVLHLTRTRLQTWKFWIWNDLLTVIISKIKSKWNPPSTGYRASWTPVDGSATWNILLTGSVTGWRKDPGWPGMMFCIPPFLPSSIRTTLTSPHPKAVAGPVVGRLEPPLEEGVLSGTVSRLLSASLAWPFIVINRKVCSAELE